MIIYKFRSSAIGRYSVNIIYFVFFFLFVLGSLSLTPSGNVIIKNIQLSGHAQGTTWHATYFYSDSVVTKRQLDSILEVIDSSLSLYKPYSTIVAFNNSTSGIKIDKHFRNVVEKSLDTYQQTNGLSDITVGPLVEAWGFGVDPHSNVPDDSVIKSLLPCVDSKNIRLHNDSLIKSKPCVKIDVNGIAQGYSVDVIASFLESNGIQNYLIELGGELRVKGKKQPGNIPFRIGIESPSGDDFNIPPMQKIIILDSGGAITTSGNYRKYRESKGKRFSHIIDPKTGKSADNEMISATVYATDAITADAYDNALMLMGVEKAIQFVENRKDLGAYLIYKKKDGKIADTASTLFRQLINRFNTSDKN